MNRDPIVEHLSMWLQRLVWFLVLSLLQATALWLWVLLSKFDVDRDGLMLWLKLAWTPVNNNPLPQVMVAGALIIGHLNTSVVYLLIGKWWKKRGDVHQRGARFDDGGM